MDCKFRTQLGLVTVDEDVIVKVAGYAALECYGIVGMAAKRSTDGIVQLMGRENLGLYGAILGKALYTDAIDLKEALRIAEGGKP